MIMAYLFGALCIPSEGPWFSVYTDACKGQDVPDGMQGAGKVYGLVGVNEF